MGEPPPGAEAQPPAALVAVRLASRADAAGVHRIYAPIVRDTAISFEWEEPTVEEIGDRIDRTLAADYPWLVALDRDQVVGYAYASLFRARAAYRWSAEVSVYVDPALHRAGLGTRLYRALFSVLALQGFRTVYAVATAPNPGSEALHARMGFDRVGVLRGVGYKFGRWHDAIVWERALHASPGEPPPIRPLPDVQADPGWAAAINAEPPERER